MELYGNYVVERSDEYLAHYGVKGMRWGVRKGGKHLDRAFTKATKKMRKLQDRADVKKQARVAKEAKEDLKNYALSVGSGAALAGTAHLAKRSGYRFAGAGRVGLVPVAFNDTSMKYTGYGIAGLGALGAGHSAAKMHNAKKRMTPKGHKKAVQKAEAWRREMNSAFKGTKYDNYRKKQKRR